MALMVDRMFSLPKHQVRDHCIVAAIASIVEGSLANLRQVKTGKQTDERLTEFGRPQSAPLSRKY
jgi:hypothetical protein